MGHIFTDKAVSRALRAHFLADASLTSLLLETVFEEGSLDKDCLMLQLKEAIKSNKEEIKGFFKSSSFGKLDNAMAIVKSQLAEKSRTAKLWILYLQYVAILKQLVFAERTSD